MSFTGEDTNETRGRRTFRLGRRTTGMTLGRAPLRNSSHRREARGPGHWTAPEGWSVSRCHNFHTSRYTTQKRCRSCRTIPTRWAVS